MNSSPDMRQPRNTCSLEKAHAYMYWLAEIVLEHCHQQLSQISISINPFLFNSTVLLWDTKKRATFSSVPADVQHVAHL